MQHLSLPQVPILQSQHFWPPVQRILKYVYMSTYLSTNVYASVYIKVNYGYGYATVYVDVYVGGWDSGSFIVLAYEVNYATR